MALHTKLPRFRKLYMVAFVCLPLLLILSYLSFYDRTLVKHLLITGSNITSVSKTFVQTQNADQVIQTDHEESSLQDRIQYSTAQRHAKRVTEPNDVMSSLTRQFEVTPTTTSDVKTDATQTDVITIAKSEATTNASLVDLKATFEPSVESSSGKKAENLQNRVMKANTDSYEKHQIAFAKIHKAASSTFQAILLRFAMSHNLTVLFRKNGQHINEGGTYINRSLLVVIPKNTTFDILCNHLIYDRDMIMNFLPNSTVHIGIIREPFSQFVSAFVYYSQIWRHKALLSVIKKYPENPISAFLKTPELLSPENPRTTFVDNRQSVDFGFPPANFRDAKNDSKKIEDFLKKIHEQFDLVLITELFDESVILVRRFMNWALKDVLYLKNNEFEKIKKREGPSWIHGANYTQDDLNRFRRWGVIDIALYNRSLEIFQGKIKKEKRFKEEVDAFKKIRTSVMDFCQKARESTDPVKPLVIQKSEWTETFEINTEECRIMGLEETRLTRLTKAVQARRLASLLKGS